MTPRPAHVLALSFVAYDGCILATARLTAQELLRARVENWIFSTKYRGPVSFVDAAIKGIMPDEIAHIRMRVTTGEPSASAGDVPPQLRLPVPEGTLRHGHVVTVTLGPDGLQWEGAHGGSEEETH